jgi:microcin C transport system permease protein
VGLVLILFKLAAVLSVMFLVTTKLIPRVFVRVGRLLGFKMELMPVTRKRLARFRRIKRGYYSFVVITTLFVTSLFLELLVNSKPLVIHYGDHTAFPAIAKWVDKVVFFTTVSSFNKKTEYGQTGKGEVDYNRFARTCDDPNALATITAALTAQQAVVDKARARLPKAPPGEGASDRKKRLYAKKLSRVSKKQASLDILKRSHEVFSRGDAWVIQTIYPYAPDDLRMEDLEGQPPYSPSIALNIPLGSDTSSRDVVPLLCYGFRISLSFALLVAFLGYCIGITVGAIQGYYGGWVDIITQRIQEIWGSIPFLFTIMIIAAIIKPTFWILAFMLVVLRSWLGITYYVRGEFYREKGKDYVQAAIGAGVADWKIMLKHILPNSLVPIVTYAPFAIVGYIGLLVSLDYLGFGLPPGTPSWGGLLRQGLERVKFDPHLTLVPVLALCATLYCVVMIGEAVREAFDPKVFSRLR